LSATLIGAGSALLLFQVPRLLRLFRPEKGQLPDDTEPISFSPGSHELLLHSYEDAQRIEVLRVVRASTGVTLGEAGALTAELPAVLVSAVSLADAEEFARRLRAVGAVVALSGATSGAGQEPAP
jgi:hypothetical protein